MQKDTQNAVGLTSDLSAELDCYFKQIEETLSEYNKTKLFDVPTALAKGFVDFVETDTELQLGGFVESKAHCYVIFNRSDSTLKRFLNGVAI